MHYFDFKNDFRIKPISGITELPMQKRKRVKMWKTEKRENTKESIKHEKNDKTQNFEGQNCEKELY